jgi:hypothetical protein
VEALERDIKEHFAGVNMTICKSDFTQQIIVDNETITGKIDTVQIIFRHYEW